MKKIDKLMLNSVGGPFLVSFAIALFVLVMQFLWLYIDEIAGKGVNIFILSELIAYLSVVTFPMALPIAVLLASVMVMGNLAERYELSSMKSAGVPLIRIMRTLIFAAAGIAVFSYICSDFLIPIANLKFRARLYEIRKQKPALTIEPGVFNEDFRQFVIRVGEKQKDGETIQSVLIEDHTRSGSLRFNQILADSGRKFTTADRRFFVMHLFRGVQYQEPAATGPQSKQKYPFVRTKFSSWTKVWDLKEFEMDRTDEDRFRTQRSMMSMNQLRQNMDSLNNMMREGRDQLAEDQLLPLRRQPMKQSPPMADSSLRNQAPAIRQPVIPATTSFVSPVAKQTIARPLRDYESLLETFSEPDRPKIRQEAEIRAKTALAALETRKLQIGSRYKESVKTGYELYIKYSYALVCFIFLFIGAPLGAIIRKGGFGYPILVSIIFFVLFVMLSIVCKKLAELFILSPFLAAMTPCIVLLPIGFFLTRRAMDDAQMFNTDGLDKFLLWIRRILEKRRAAA
ncbi:MAG: LptF/LptG family permease [Saprospiraceae bacterium]